MKLPILFLGAALAVAASLPAEANDRYAERPPVVVSPDLAAPWVMQLQRKRATYGWLSRNKQQPVTVYRRVKQTPTQRYTQVKRYVPDPQQTAALPAQPQMYTKQEMQRKLDPKFYPQQVEYAGSEKPGTIIIDSAN